MRLRSKLMLITAAASITPVVVGTMVGRAMVQSRSRAGFERRLDEGEQRVLAEFGTLQREVKEAVTQLSKGDDDLFSQQILIALAKGGPDAALVRRLNDETPGVMRQRGLDVLTVLGPDKRVLACGHFPGRIGDVQRGSMPTRPVLVRERVFESGRQVTLLTIQVWTIARHSLGTRMHVMGGRALDGRFLRALRGRLVGTEVLLQDGSGERLAGPDDWQQYARFPQRIVRLAGPGGREAARVTLAVSDEQLRTTLRVINYVAAALIGGGMLLSLLLGVIARRVSRPLEELAIGAQAVAGGDLERKIPVRSQDEIGELVATFNHMTEQLRESHSRLAAAERVAAWRAIAQRIAHEIKNPLSPIQTSIETLRKVYRKKHPKFDEIFEESTTTILDEVARLKRIVTEFSSFARMPKPELAPCDLVEVVRSVVALHPSEAIPLDLQIEQEPLPRLMADREQLTQVLHNLLKNATEALVDVARPRISVRLRAEDGSVVVEVVDNGPGFAENLQPAQLFTPYFTTKGSSGGSGLGLAIVHRIVTDHGGTIEAHSRLDGGARFVVRLPAGHSTRPC